MSVYTKTGDGGETGLFSGERVSKGSERILAYGAVDELNSVVGVVRAVGVDTQMDAILEVIQTELFDVGARMATLRGSDMEKYLTTPGDDALTWMEQAMDHYLAKLPQLKNFVLPGGCEAAAHLHVARTVCRRAESLAVGLPEECAPCVKYLNRLSDLLYVLARVANQDAGVTEPEWSRKQRPVVRDDVKIGKP